MKKMTYFLLFIALLTISCKKDANNVGQYTAVIDNITDNIIIATYTDMDNSAAELVTATTALKNNASDTIRLLEAKTAWIAVRSAWEASEGFLFGPVSDLDIDPNIDTWPLDSTGIDNILSGAATIDKNYIDNLTGEAGTGLKGFHAIEYILWGMDGNRVAGDFSIRELEYLVACAESLKGQTSILKNAWTGSTNYADIVKKHNNNIYSSEVAVLVELAEGIRGIAGEVWNSKIQNTLDGYNSEGAAGGIREEESRFSNNTKSDFEHNIISIKNVYLGTYKTLGNGKGLSIIVNKIDENLDNIIKAQIAEAIEAIKNIGGSKTQTYSQALQSNIGSIEDAQDKVKALEITLETKLLPLINQL